jgi:oligopeptide/dipeptide ABC transporter ATP-binding protein
VIELVDVTKRYGPVRALDGVSLALEPGVTLGLVGESGSGKSTVGRLVVGLERPSSGELRFKGRPYPRSARRLRPLRRIVSMVFQDPYDSLDPRFTIGDVVAEPLRAHRRPDGGRVRALLDLVGLEGVPPDTLPGALSGGQRQRVGVARALALQPQIVICDEPTSALDVSVQAQILNLLLALQRDQGLGYLFISHDLDVVRRMSDEVIVLYAGSIMEQGPASQVATRPRHPYTTALVAAIPGEAPDRRRLADRPRLAEGMVSAAAEGCPFSTRCPRVQDRCRAERPPLADGLACFFPGS